MKTSLIVIGIMIFLFVIIGIVFVILIKKHKDKLQYKESKIQDKEIQITQKNKTETIKQNPEAVDYFENNKRIWMYNTKTSIKVDGYDYIEIFDEFPFLSQYKETKIFLNSKNVSMTKVNELLKRMRSYETVILKSWQKNSRVLKEGFDKTHLKYNRENSMFLLGYYNHFLTAFRDTVDKELVNNILRVELEWILNNQDNVLIKNDFIKKTIYKINEILKVYVQKIITKLYEDLNIDLTKNETTKGDQANFEEQTYSKAFDEFKFYYDILELDKAASNDEVKHAYRKLAMKYHPDINKATSAVEKMIEINKAYEIIKKLRDLK